MPAVRWWAPRARRNQRHTLDHAADFTDFGPWVGANHPSSLTTSPASERVDAGEKRSRPATSGLHTPHPGGVRRLREFFTGRRQATPRKSRGLASDEGMVTVFHPPAVEQALDRNMDAIARLVEATKRPQLDADLRDILLLATTDVRIANQRLSLLLDSCALCGHHPVQRVCANCGARKGKP